MKTKRTLLPALLLFAGWLTGTVACAQSSRKQATGLRKGTNISLNISDNQKQPPCTYVNVGLLSSFPDLNGFSLNVLSSVNHYDSKGGQVSGLVNITGIDAGGVHIAGLGHLSGRNYYGLTLGGLVNVAGRSTKGLTLSALGNISGSNISGTAISGLLNVSNGAMSGFHIAGLANVARKKQEGLMVGGALNLSADSLSGAQIAILMNIVGKDNRGVQTAALSNLAVENSGLQLSAANYAETNKGLQLGLINFAACTHRGWQVGLLNMSSDSISTNQIGLFNLHPHTRIQMVAGSGNLNIAHLSVRFKNRFSYTEIGGGLYPLGIDRKFSVSAFYRMGLFCRLTRRMEVAADAAFYHVEALDNKHENGCPERLYIFQPRVNATYAITSKVGLFVAGGYSWTRYYNRNCNFDHQPAFEAGIVLF